MFERGLLVHYHEIGLKGKNRGRFERQLVRNLQTAAGGLTGGTVSRFASRLFVPITDEDALEALIERVARTPGVSYLGDAYVASRLPDDMARAALHALRVESERRGGAATFAIDARRSATDHPESSMEINRRVGAYVQAETGLAVNLGAPDVTVRIEVVQGDTYVYARRVEGAGGLPIGASGRVVSLLSAGIDSPVATWRMMKRGATVTAVHFSGRPQTDAASEHLVADICRTLGGWGGVDALVVVPFGDLQREIALACPPDLRVLLYRRLMVRVAEAIAGRAGARALVTGESLGQVASQTLDNIAVVDAVANMPVLRPLIGMDKQEIIAEAQALGTYEISTQSHDDCCTLFMPRTPETHATVAQVEAGEVDLDLERMVSDALALAETVGLK